jgi:uncharacterized protein with ATP-grasp and redox domains
MKSDVECLYCLLKQAFNTAVLATPDKALQEKVVRQTAQWIQEADLNRSPADISTKVYRLVSEITGVKDPYLEVKRQTNQQALDLIPMLEKWLSSAQDPLDVALHLSVAGNIIDMGIGHDFDLKQDIGQIVNTPFTLNDIEAFRKEIKKDKELLFLGDNSGEIVFDGLLIKWLQEQGLNITYVVKSGPIINDAMMEDAETAGITNMVPVIETGSDDIGILWENISPELERTFQESEIIIAKGHGNFESCDELPYNLYFLLKAKCNVVANALSVKQGDIVFRHIDNR